MSNNYFHAIGKIEDYYMKIKQPINKKGEDKMANYLKMWKNEESWQDEVESKLLNYQIKRHEIINIAINIILASICIFVLDLKLWMLPIAFIVCDILLMPLNILFVRIIPDLRKKINDVNYFVKRNQKIAKLIEQKREKLERLSYHNPSKSLIKSDIRTLEDELLGNEKRINELQDKMTTVTSVYDKISKDNKQKITDTITLLASFKTTVQMQEAGINLSEVVLKSKKIKKVLEEKPQMMDISNTTFNLYGTELLNILQDVKAMDPDEQHNYFDKIKELIYEYELHLDRLEERIKKDDYIKTSVDINVLLNEITKDKKGDN